MGRSGPEGFDDLKKKLFDLWPSGAVRKLGNANTGGMGEVRVHIGCSLLIGGRIEMAALRGTVTGQRSTVEKYIAHLRAAFLFAVMAQTRLQNQKLIFFYMVAGIFLPDVPASAAHIQKIEFIHGSVRMIASFRTVIDVAQCDLSLRYGGKGQHGILPSLLSQQFLFAELYMKLSGMSIQIFRAVFYTEQKETHAGRERRMRMMVVEKEEFTMYNTPVSLKNFRVADGFWKDEMELVRTEVLPYQWEILNDRVEGAAPSFCMRNFRVAEKITKERLQQGDSWEEPAFTFRGWEALPEDPEHMEDKFYGFVFQDSDFSKWIEAVAYSLVNHPDEELERIADAAIDQVCAVQQENGYLDTFYIINGLSRVFTNLRDHHELYCFGHLTEGAVAYYQATGKRKLLDAAIRFADYIDENFGTEEGKRRGYPGHEIAEMALIRLYEVTKEPRYLKLAQYFLDERGKQPYYWDCESADVKHGDGERYAYYQAHRPVREQDEAVGHAVRAMYLYAGMTDAARLAEDSSLWEACRKLWDSTVHEKMYITGGVGGTSIGEAFSFPFDLPNDLAYAETCASIGLIFWARRMLQKEVKREYGDVMELALYNTVLSGMALDGKSFFYVNPLEVLPEACHEDERKQHVKAVRQKWFGCACCPPNLARLVSSIPTYAYTEDEQTLYMHLHIGGTVTKDVNGTQAVFEIASGFPWNGNVTVTYRGETQRALCLAVRIPSWYQEEAGAFQREIPSSLAASEKDGYLYLSGTWHDGDVIRLDFTMRPVVLQADSRVREDIGKVAVMCGPVVYCAEEADNGKDLHLYRILPEETMIQDTVQIEGRTFPALRVKAKKLCAKEKKAQEVRGLYHRYTPEQYEEAELLLIPYYTWANRGENEMMVWLR